MEGAVISEAQKKLAKVFDGDYVHENPGTHLHGGIGAALDMTFQQYLRRLIPYNFNLYDVPKGKVGKAITKKLADLFEGVQLRKHNSEVPMLFIILILHRVSNITKSGDIRKRLTSQLERWEGDPSQLESMVEEAEHDFKLRRSKLRGNHTPNKLAKIYDRILSRGGIRSAVRFVTDREGGGVMHPDEIDDSSGKPVHTLLKEKHPNLCHVDPTVMEDYESTPEFVPITITEDDVEHVAAKLSGSSGLTGFDSTALQNMLLQHGHASKRLRQVLANFANWLANSFPPWAAYRALMMCREVAFSKTKGIRPLGIGDIFRRFLAKLIVLKAGPYATNACGADQLCAGL